MWGEKCLFQFAVPYHSPSSKEGRAGSQGRNGSKWPAEPAVFIWFRTTWPVDITPSKLAGPHQPWNKETAYRLAHRQSDGSIFSVAVHLPRQLYLVSSRQNTSQARQLVTWHLQTGSRQEWMPVLSLLTLPLLIQLGLRHPDSATFRVCLPCSMKLPKTASQTRQRLPGDFKACYSEDQWFQPAMLFYCYSFINSVWIVFYLSF